MTRRVARVSRRIASEGCIVLHRFPALRMGMDRPAPLRAWNHPETDHTGRYRQRQPHAHTHIDALVLMLVLVLTQTRQTPSRGNHSRGDSPRRLRRLGSCKRRRGDIVHPRHPRSGIMRRMRMMRRRRRSERGLIIRRGVERREGG